MGLEAVESLTLLPGPGPLAPGHCWPHRSPGGGVGDPMGCLELPGTGATGQKSDLVPLSSGRRPFQISRLSLRDITYP